jgi:acetyl-CoA carboxylase carboxyltransferase component
MTPLEELGFRREQALAMGGAEGVARQHSQGKLTARERVDGLVDAGSFREFGMLGGKGTYVDGRLVSVLPKAVVHGTCLLDGRKAVVTAGDFTVKGGSGLVSRDLGAEPGPADRALEERLPFIRLLDAAGGSVRTFDEIGRTYLPDGNVWSAVESELLNVAPVVSAVLGSVAGLPAINAVLAHWNVMVRGTAQIFPGGPPVVKAALGYDITKEELGGAELHTTVSGVVDNVADSEKDAFEQIRRFLSYLPASVDELAPVLPAVDPVGAAQDLRTVIPENRRRPFDVKRLIKLVVDDGSFFEIAGHYGRSRTIGFARIGGYPVGLMANNPRHLGGSTDVAAGNKAIKLIQLCNLFHLPLISLADEPGFMVGLDSEKQGIERAGARLLWTLCQSRMPMATVVVGRLYGVGGQCHHRPSGMFRRFAWPSARWGSMHIAGGAAAAYRREIESAEDPDAARAAIEARLENIASPFRTAEATLQDMIDPAETRQNLLEFAQDAQRVLSRQLGAPSTPFHP